MREMSSFESALVNILATLACLGIIIMIPYTYIHIPEADPSFTYAVSWLVANGIWGLVAYAMFTALAGFSPQTHPWLYHLAHFAAVGAFLSTFVTFAVVVWQFVQSGQEIHQLADIPGSMHLLLGTLGVAVIDMVWLQWHKHKALLRYEQGSAGTSAQAGSQTVATPVPNTLQELMATSRVFPGVKIRLKEVTVEFDPARNLLIWDIPEFPGMTLVPAVNPGPSVN